LHSRMCMDTSAIVSSKSTHLTTAQPPLREAAQLSSRFLASSHRPSRKSSPHRMQTAHPCNALFFPALWADRSAQTLGSWWRSAHETTRAARGAVGTARQSRHVWSVKLLKPLCTGNCGNFMWSAENASSHSSLFMFITIVSTRTHMFLSLSVGTI